MATRICMALMTEPGERRSSLQIAVNVVPIQTAQQDPFVTMKLFFIKMKSPSKKERPVSVPCLSVGMDGALAGRLLQMLGVRPRTNGCCAPWPVQRTMETSVGRPQRSTQHPESTDSKTVWKAEHASQGVKFPRSRCTNVLLERERPGS